MRLPTFFSGASAAKSNTESEADDAGNVQRTIWIWGWLRLWLGVAQMVLSAAAFVAVMKIGLTPKTVILSGFALAGLTVSRYVYRGARTPPAKPRTKR